MVKFTKGWTNTKTLVTKPVGQSLKSLKFPGVVRGASCLDSKMQCLTRDRYFVLPNIYLIGVSSQLECLR